MTALSNLMELLDLPKPGFTVRRGEANLIVENKLGMQAVVRETDDGALEVLYERAVHEPVRERCSPEIAAKLIRIVMARTELQFVQPPEA